MKNHDVFKRRGVAYDEPLPLFGNLFEVFLGNFSIESKIEEFCGKFKNEKSVEIPRIL